MGEGVWGKEIKISFKIKHVVWLILVAILFYAGAVLRIAWGNKMGYVVMQESPFYSSIPQDCINFARRHVAINNTAKDELFLTRRGIRLNEKHLNPSYGRIRCLGFAVLTGLHGNPSRLGDFQDMYVDGAGDPIVTIKVIYHKTYWADAKATKQGGNQ